MRRTTILRGERYTVESLGNGWGYIVEDHEARKSVWLQDEEASDFRALLARYERRYPTKTVDGVLGRLWFDQELDIVADDMALAA